MIERTMRAIRVVLALACFASSTWAQTPRSKSADADVDAHLRAALDVPVQRASLQNGLRVVMSVSRATSTASVCAVYQAGVRDEASHEAGYAHLLEQVMRRPELLERPLRQRGGTTSSRTENDFTAFCTTVPAGELSFAIWMEAQRLLPSLVDRDAVRRARPRAAVTWRQSADGTARRAGRRRLLELTLQGYRRTEPDPAAAVAAVSDQEVEQLRSFFQSHYRPDRMVLSIAGDFDTDTAMQWARTYLEPMAAAGVAASYVPPPVVRPTSERYLSFELDEGTTPSLFVGYSGPEVGSREYRALTLIAEVLGGGVGSRLYTEMVERLPLATEVRAWTSQDQGPAVLGIELVPSHGVATETLEKGLRAQVGRLGYAGPTDAELVAARRRVGMRLLKSLQPNQSRALVLGRHELLGGDVRQLGREFDAYASVTRVEARDAMRKWVWRSPRATVCGYPAGWHQIGGTGQPMQRYHIVNSGENLTVIASRYGVTLEALVSENKLRKNQPIYPGDKLKLPAGARKPKAGPAKPTSKPAAAPAQPAQKAAPKKPTSKPAAASEQPTHKSASASGRSSKPRGSIKGSTANSPQGKARAPEPKQPRVHVVREHQTLSGIAKLYGVSLDALLRQNGLSKRRPIRPGQRLVIPEAAKKP